MARLTHSKSRKQFKTFWAAAFAVNFVFLAGAVLQINNYIHQNSLLKDYQRQIASLISENDTLEARLSQSNSLENFSEYSVAQAGNYEKVDIGNVRYVTASGNQFAKK